VASASGSETLACTRAAGRDAVWPELDEADKSSEHGQYLNRRYRRAAAYEVLDGLLTTAIQKHQQVEEQLASFLKSSPTLGRHLARWQAEDAKT